MTRKYLPPEAFDPAYQPPPLASAAGGSSSSAGAAPGAAAALFPSLQAFDFQTKFESLQASLGNVLHAGSSGSRAAAQAASSGLADIAQAGRRASATGGGSVPGATVVRLPLVFNRP